MSVFMPQFPEPSENQQKLSAVIHRHVTMALMFENMLIEDAIESHTRIHGKLPEVQYQPFTCRWKIISRD